MSDQFNISSIPGFSISQIEPSDLPTVLDCMNEIYRELPEKSWFSMDEREDLIRYMTVSGFGLKAEAVAADGRKELAAVFVARTSDLGDENLGSYLEQYLQNQESAGSGKLFKLGRLLDEKENHILQIMLPYLETEDHIIFWKTMYRVPDDRFLYKQEK